MFRIIKKGRMWYAYIKERGEFIEVCSDRTRLEVINIIEKLKGNVNK